MPQQKKRDSQSGAVLGAAAVVAIAMVAAVALASPAQGRPMETRARLAHVHSSAEFSRGSSRASGHTTATATAVASRTGPTASVVAPPQSGDGRPTPADNGAPVEPALVVLAVLLGLGFISAVVVALVRRRRPRA